MAAIPTSLALDIIQVLIKNQMESSKIASQSRKDKLFTCSLIILLDRPNSKFNAFFHGQEILIWSGLAKLFDSYALCQVSWLIDIAAKTNGYMIAQVL